MTHVMIQTWLLAALANAECEFDNATGTFDFGGLRVTITDEGFAYSQPEGAGLVESVSHLKAFLQYA